MRSHAATTTPQTLPRSSAPRFVGGEQHALQRRPFLLISYRVSGKIAGYEEAQANSEARYGVEDLTVLQERELFARKQQIRAHQAQHDPGEHGPHRAPGTVEVLFYLPGSDTEEF